MEPCSTDPRDRRAATDSGWRGRVATGAALDLVLFALLRLAGLDWSVAQAGSFLAASLLLAWLQGWRWQHRGRSSLPKPRWLSLVTVQLMGLALRALLLVALIDREGLSPGLAILGGVVLAWSVAWVGARLWVDAMDRRDEEHPGVQVRRTTALVVYALLLRLLLAGTVELLHEEAYYWNYAQHMDLGYLDHPPMVAWLIGASTTFLGQTELAVRLPALLCGALTAYYACLLALDVRGPAVARTVLLLVAALPLTFGTGLLMTPDAPLLACWAGALYHLQAALVQRRDSSWPAIGLFLGLGLLSKYTIVLLGASAAVFLLVDRDARVWLRRSGPYLALAVAALLAAPVALWNASNGWVSFGFQTLGRLDRDYHFSLQDLLGGLLVLLTPVGMLAAALAIRNRAAAVGARGDRAVPERAARLLLVSVLLPLAVFTAFSLFRLVKLNWTAPLWLGLLPFMAAPTLRAGTGAADRWSAWVARAWRPALVGLLVALGLGGYQLALGIPGLPSGAGRLGTGMGAFAADVEREVQELRAESGEEPLVVCLDTDRLASWLAYYRARAAQPRSAEQVRRVVDHTTGGQLFGYDSNMYARWHPLGRLQGRPVVLVSTRPERFEKAEDVDSARPLGGIRTLALLQRGRAVGEAYLRPARVLTEPERLGVAQRRARQPATSATTASARRPGPTSAHDP